MEEAEGSVFANKDVLRPKDSGLVPPSIDDVNGCHECLASAHLAREASHDVNRGRIRAAPGHHRVPLCIPVGLEQVQLRLEGAGRRRFSEKSEMQRDADQFALALGKVLAVPADGLEHDVDFLIAKGPKLDDLRVRPIAEPL